MKLLIAGGGTGGHIFPGMAVAEEFLGRDPENEVLFVGTENGIEIKVLPRFGYRLELIRSRGIVELGLIEKIQGLSIIPLSLLQSIKIIRGFRPDFALGVGGYVSGPVLVAAWLLHLPRAIHEQNTVPGLTNKILSRFSNKVFISFDEARAYFKQAEKKNKIMLTGNPIRKKILERLMGAEKAEKSSGRFCLLVVGGSQGAQRVNQLVLDALPHLSKYRDSLTIVHQTGEKGQYDVALAYARHGFRAKVKNFIDNLEEYLVDCDLLVSRAGAGAIAEIALSGRPSILIPFPYAAEDHQTKNADCLVREGAAVLCKESDLNGRKLADILDRLIRDRDKLKQMSEKAQAASRPRAAADLVDEIYALINAKKKAGD